MIGDRSGSSGDFIYTAGSAAIVRRLRAGERAPRHERWSASGRRRCVVEIPREPHPSSLSLRGDWVARTGLRANLADPTAGSSRDGDAGLEHAAWSLRAGRETSDDG